MLPRLQFLALMAGGCAELNIFNIWKMVLTEWNPVCLFQSDLS